VSSVEVSGVRAAARERLLSSFMGSLFARACECILHRFSRLPCKRFTSVSTHRTCAAAHVVVDVRRVVGAPDRIDNDARVDIALDIAPTRARESDDDIARLCCRRCTSLHFMSPDSSVTPCIYITPHYTLSLVSFGFGMKWV